MKRQRHTLKEIMAAKREAHGIVYQKLFNEVMPYGCSALVMRFIRGIIEDHKRKGPPCPQECDARSKNVGSKPS